MPLARGPTHQYVYPTNLPLDSVLRSRRRRTDGAIEKDLDSDFLHDRLGKVRPVHRRCIGVKLDSQPDVDPEAERPGSLRHPNGESAAPGEQIHYPNARMQRFVRRSLAPKEGRIPVAVGARGAVGCTWAAAVSRRRGPAR